MRSLSRVLGRRGVGALALFCVTVTAAGQANEPNLQQTQRFIREKLPVFAYSVGFDQDNQIGFGTRSPSFTVTFTGCRMALHETISDLSLDAAIEFGKTEPIQSSRDRVYIYAQGRRETIPIRYAQNGKPVEQWGSRLLNIVTDAPSPEHTRSLARSFRRLRSLCGAEANTRR